MVVRTWHEILGAGHVDCDPEAFERPPGRTAWSAGAGAGVDGFFRVRAKFVAIEKILNKG